MRVQLLGSSRLSRVVLPYLLERRGARISAVDLGEEHEARPWFAPMRGMLHDEGIPAGRLPADRVIDCDPDARPAAPEGIGLRVLAPPGARSADPNRALLDGGAWEVVVTDGRGAWARRPLEVEPEDDAATVLDRAVLRMVEALDEAWERLGDPPDPLPRALLAGRWRDAETHVLWEQPAPRVVARIRASAGPWGGARALLGETAVRLLDARIDAAESPPGFTAGTIVAVDRGIVVATGRGTVRVERLRPGWRPAREAGAFVTESGLSPGYQFS
ncbi:MAG: hypothetical protein ACOZNI_19690 [Myxococcota bacterium]